MVARHDWGLNPGSCDCKPTTLAPSDPSIPAYGAKDSSLVGMCRKGISIAGSALFNDANL